MVFQEKNLKACYQNYLSFYMIKKSEFEEKNFRENRNFSKISKKF